MTTPYYQRAYRRILVDMHIPDWNPAFLSQYDPLKMIELYERAHVNSVMVYCQSHFGLCYWPTTTGKMHANLNGRDIVGETVRELKKRDIATCAYYSVVANNWAMREHPEWRVVPHMASPAEAYHRGRMGMCCANNPGYRAFAIAQAQEIASHYDFDGFFFDITFWLGVCLCAHCQVAYRKKTGKEIPHIANWHDPDWCMFQTAREEWLNDFTHDLTQAVKIVKPDMPVYHNCACIYHKWLFGVPATSAAHHDFLGGDFYGDPTDQLTITKLLLNLTENRPVEFMTSRCLDLKDHVLMKRHELMEMQAFAAILFSSAFLYIDAIDPVGTANPTVYDRIGRIFAKTEQYEPYLGGESLEDVAVYFSSESKMSFSENGKRLVECADFFDSYPHRDAVRGVCRSLQRTHIPFGVITRKQIGSLDRYKLIILPNVHFMDSEEADAYREYVRRGGKLYASGYTSLRATHCPVSGTLSGFHFLLADVFGCQYAGQHEAPVYYVKPRDTRIAEWLAPQDYFSMRPTAASARLVVKMGDGELPPTSLATLTFPYACPKPGCALDNNWSSFHSLPPWEDTDIPAIVANTFGKGRAIYSAAEIETDDQEVNERLFLNLIRSLVDEPLSYTADTHPAIWMNVMHQSDKNRFLIGFLNYQAQLPAVPIERVPFTLRAPAGRRFTKLIQLPGRTSVPFSTDPDGALRAEAHNLETFQMLLAETK